VPARAGEALAAELLPVFAAVDVIADEANAIAESAEPEAERAVLAGHEQAARIREDGARRAEEQRGLVAAARERSVQAELARIAGEADREVARIAEVAAPRRSVLVAEVVDRLRSLS
jgi:vacuolar-type H+-ATPase subunit E/Vma4